MCLVSTGGYYKRAGVFCNGKDYSPQRRKGRKEKQAHLSVIFIQINPKLSLLTHCPEVVL